MSSSNKSFEIKMRVKKPLLSTYIFAGILIAGLITLYILTSKALESDTSFTSSDANATVYTSSK